LDLVNLEGGLVLGASAQGLLVLRIKHHDVNTLKAWTLVGSEKTIAHRLFLLPVTNLEGCKVAKVQALSPIGLAKLTKQDAPRACVYITMGGVEAVERAAAREGFRGLTCAFLEKAMTHFKLRFTLGARPTRERDMVSALVRACWPEVTEAELAACLKARGQTHTLDDANAVLLDPEEIDALDIGLDADDLKVVKDQAKKVNIARGNKKAKLPSESAPVRMEALVLVPEETAAAEEIPKDWVERPFPTADEDITLAIAKTFLPEVRGCTISKDVKRFSRWSAQYPRAFPPTHVSKSWGPTTGHTVSSSLEFVVRTL
jgi:hypothetical protein